MKTWAMLCSTLVVTILGCGPEPSTSATSTAMQPQTGGTAPPPPSDEESDVTALKEGFITLTPLHFDLTKPNEVAAMKKWRFEPPRSL